MESIKAKLRVVLMADDVEVASSDDPRLWAHALKNILGQQALEPTGQAQPPEVQ